MVLIFFGCRINSLDCNSKNSGRDDFLFFIYKFIMTVSFTFLTRINFDIIFIIFMCIGCFVLFEINVLNLNHKNVIISKLFTIL